MSTMMDVETIEHLDFKHEIPCFWTRPCDKKVVWRAVHQCCGDINFHCEEHKIESVKWLVWVESAPYSGAVHNSCGYRFPADAAADDIIRFYPVEF